MSIIKGLALAAVLTGSLAVTSAHAGDGSLKKWINSAEERFDNRFDIAASDRKGPKVVEVRFTPDAGGRIGGSMPGSCVR